MTNNIILDTGPLVALLDRSDRFHSWAVETWKTSSFPLLTCEAVISESCFLLRRVQGGEDAIMGLLSRGHIRVSFQLDGEVETIRELMRRYQNVPMSFADACLVRMSETIASSSIFTLDSDFSIYRKQGNQTIAIVSPLFG